MPMKCRARSIRLARGMPVNSSGKATLSVTLRQGKVDSSWNTIPIDLCGPEIVSPPTRPVPSCCDSSPPITLNKVDLPQPDGPMIERNSPCRTLNETLSTAVTGPSGVSKRTDTSSAVRIVSVLTREGALWSISLALAQHGAGHDRRVTRLDAHVDDGDRAVFHRGDGLLKHVRQIPDSVHRPECSGALRARHGGEIDVGLGYLLPDPAVLDRAAAHARDALLVQFIVEERAVVGDDDQQRNFIMRRGPHGGHAHQKIAVAAHRDGKTPRALQRERRADRNAGAAADAAAAVGAEIIQWMAEGPARAIPGERHMRERSGPRTDGAAQRIRHVVDGE